MTRAAGKWLRSAIYGFAVTVVLRPSESRDGWWAEQLIPVVQARHRPALLGLEQFADHRYLNAPSLRQLYDSSGKEWTNCLPRGDDAVGNLVVQGHDVYVSGFRGQRVSDVSRVPAHLTRSFWAEHRHTNRLEVTGRVRWWHTMIPWVWRDRATEAKLVLLDFSSC